MFEIMLGTLKRAGLTGGFIEELTGVQFATYASMTALVGINDGTLINTANGWLRFILNGVELIVAKANIRQAISWDQLDSLGCVFGTKIIAVQGFQYRVRLLKGADNNPTVIAAPGHGHFMNGTHYSEWSQLFYPLIRDDPNYVNPEGIYTQAQLQTNSVPYSWCQETHQGNTSWRIVRGASTSAYVNIAASSNTNAAFGWRPCLERIP